MKTIYPKIDLRETEESLSILTTLRKEHNGKWYLWNFYKQWELQDNSDRQKLIEQFHQEVYFTIILGIVQEDITDMYGNLICKEDENQISEIDRIKDLLHFKKSSSENEIEP